MDKELAFIQVLKERINNNIVFVDTVFDLYDKQVLSRETTLTAIKSVTIDNTEISVKLPTTENVVVPVNVKKKIKSGISPTASIGDGCSGSRFSRSNC